MNETDDLLAMADCNNDLINIEIVDEVGNIIENIHDLPSSTAKSTDTEETTTLLLSENNDEDSIENHGNENDLDNQQDTIIAIVENKSKPRKRVRDPSQWKVNKRTKNCQEGKEYTSRRGKAVKARRIISTKNCLQNCKFQCGKKISTEERQQFFEMYWSLSQNEKYVLLGQVTTKVMKSRKTTEGPSRRQYTYNYFIKTRGETIRVCKDFFLGTLNISQTPIYTAHSIEGTPKKDNRGRTGSRAISEDKKKDVMDHINMFPVIESHYCRRTVKRKYLESNLSVAKMYDLYIKWCTEQHKTPVRMSMYRRIFVTQYNYGFHMPKKDRCIKCETYKLKKSENSLTDEEKKIHELHISKKEQMRRERTSDRENQVPVLSFDLENVITCPRAEVGDFFYLSKFNIYNLTGKFSLTGVTYCAIWTELQQGRGGNILASAFRAILDRVLQDNNISDLCTWSDSCVSQNRNSMISYAVMDALKENPDLRSVTMKYSIAGHGAIQEIDNIHSNIEKYMDKTEFYSPLSFIRNLKSVNKKKPYVIIQLKDKDFKDFETCAKKLAFKNVPFTKVASIKFTQNLSEVEYKSDHSQKEFTKVSLRPDIATGSREYSPRTIKGKQQLLKQKNKSNLNIQSGNLMFNKPKVMKQKMTLSIEKQNAIKKMAKSCMPTTDKQYFLCLLNTIKKN